MSTALNDVVIERERQKQNGMDDFDKHNTKDNWVAYVATYAGRASSALRNERENETSAPTWSRPLPWRSPRSRRTTPAT